MTDHKEEETKINTKGDDVQKLLTRLVDVDHLKDWFLYPNILSYILKFVVKYLNKNDRIEYLYDIFSTIIKGRGSLINLIHCIIESIDTFILEEYREKDFGVLLFASEINYGKILKIYNVIDFYKYIQNNESKSDCVAFIEASRWNIDFYRSDKRTRRIMMNKVAEGIHNGNIQRKYIHYYIANATLIDPCLAFDQIISWPIEIQYWIIDVLARYNILELREKERDKLNDIAVNVIDKIDEDLAARGCSLWPFIKPDVCISVLNRLEGDLLYRAILDWHDVPINIRAEALLRLDATKAIYAYHVIGIHDEYIKVEIIRKAKRHALIKACSYWQDAFMFLSEKDLDALDNSLIYTLGKILKNNQELMVYLFSKLSGIYKINAGRDWKCITPELLEKKIKDLTCDDLYLALMTWPISKNVLDYYIKLLPDDDKIKLNIIMGMKSFIKIEENFLNGRLVSDVIDMLIACAQDILSFYIYRRDKWLLKHIYLSYPRLLKFFHPPLKHILNRLSSEYILSNSSQEQKMRILKILDRLDDKRIINVASMMKPDDVVTCISMKWINHPWFIKKIYDKIDLKNKIDLYLKFDSIEKEKLADQIFESKSRDLLIRFLQVEFIKFSSSNHLTIKDVKWIYNIIEKARILLRSNSSNNDIMS
ncbi:MAG: hypothetical protein NZM04_09445 [Methylacidiphilales bacterium]|nr:hypothetical protein [Candidatus Methylacidiphilales bacterium]